MSDSTENLDLTNAEFGDASLVVICEYLKGSKVKSAKLIRNKLTDEGFKKMFSYFGGVINLNLSQNLLTEHILDMIFDNIASFPSLKVLTLSQNKIIERKHKAKIEKLRKMEIMVSV